MPAVKAGDIDLFYQDDDFADPWVKHDTVFIQHGFGRNSNFFRGWVPWLARHYRVIRMDLRGHAGSGDPGPDYRFSADGFLRDFIGFLDVLKIDKVHYIGESLGGLILGEQLGQIGISLIFILILLLKPTGLFGGAR